jgi:hypothetical protein
MRSLLTGFYSRSKQLRKVGVTSEVPEGVGGEFAVGRSLLARSLLAQDGVRTVAADKNEEGHAMILFGGWQREEQSRRWVSARRANVAPTAAHVISVEVVGDPSRIDPLLQGIDFTSLATALTR